jgi:hypothetical protein
LAVVREREGIVYRIELGHWFPRLLLGFEAIAWNRVIYCRSHFMSASLHCHEFQHLVQQRDAGLWRFTIRYTIDALRFGYFGIPYEREAYAMQRVQERVATFDALGQGP